MFAGLDYEIISGIPELHKLGDVVVIIDGEIIIIELEYGETQKKNDLINKVFTPRTWLRKFPFHPNSLKLHDGINSLLESREVLYKHLQSIGMKFSLKYIPMSWTKLVQISNDFGAFRVTDYQDYMAVELCQGIITQTYTHLFHRELMIHSINPNYTVYEIDMDNLTVINTYEFS